MDADLLFQTIVAVFVGNAAFASFALGILQIIKSDQRGQGFDGVPFWAFVCILAPLAFCAFILFAVYAAI